MEKPKIAARQPQEVELEAGVLYRWCKCGRSTKQPFCDDIGHVGTGIEPKIFKVSTARKVWLCMCKQTKTIPYCDGSHNTL